MLTCAAEPLYLEILAQATKYVHEWRDMAWARAAKSVQGVAPSTRSESEHAENFAHASVSADTARLVGHSSRDAWSGVGAQTPFAVGWQVCYSTSKRSPGASRIALKGCPNCRSHRVGFGIRGLGFSGLAVRKNRWGG